MKATDTATWTYEQVVTARMDRSTKVFHVHAHVSAALVRRGNFLRFRAINERILAVAENAVAFERLPTGDELDVLADTLALLESSDPTRCRRRLV